MSTLPTVGIIYNYANASDAPAKALIAEGYQGIVSAGVGNGNLYKTVFDTLATAAHNGVAVVRSSACLPVPPPKMQKWMILNSVLWQPER